MVCDGSTGGTPTAPSTPSRLLRMADRPLHPPVWDLKAGDTGTHIIARIEGVDTTDNLDTVSVVAGRVWPVGQPDQGVALSGTVETSADRTVRLNMSPWLDGLTETDDTDPAEYHAVIILTAGSQDPWTWPERGYLEFRVWPAGVTV